MRKLGLIALSLLIFASCQNTRNKVQETNKNDSVMVGKSKSEHPCDAGAGYRWSIMKQACIKIFDIGFRLNPVGNQKGTDAVSAITLMSEDQSQLELFLPNDTLNSVILNKVDNYTYQNATYKYDADKSILYADGKVLYKGNVE